MKRADLLKEIEKESLEVKIVLRKLIEKTIGKDEEIYSKFWKDKGSESSYYYVVTSKRFFIFHLSPDLFGYRFCPLRLLKGYEEIIKPYDGMGRNPEHFGKNDLPGEYTVKFSFNTDDEKLKEIKFPLSWDSHELKELKEFINGFHEAIACL